MSWGSVWGVPALGTQGEHQHAVYRRKFRSQTSDNIDRWKSRGGKSQRGEAKKWEDQRRERVRRKKMQVRAQVGKSRFTVFFQWFVALEGRKVGGGCRASWATWEMKNCTPLWLEAHFQAEMYKTHHSQTTFGVETSKKCTRLWREAPFQVKSVEKLTVRNTFGSFDVKKVYAVVARSTFPNTILRALLEVQRSKKCTRLWREPHFQVNVQNTPFSDHFWSWDVEKVYDVVRRTTFPSQNVQNTPFSDHFWKLRCRKSGHRCGAKHISKSKCTKYTILRPLLEVEMSKKWTPLWREAHFQVKMYKIHHSQTLLEVEMSKKCTPLWREPHFQVKMYKIHHSQTTFGSWDVEKVDTRCGAKHISKSKCTKYTILRHLRPLLEVEMSKKVDTVVAEAHFQVKMHKTHHSQTTFGSWDVEKVYAVVARSTCASQNAQNHMFGPLLAFDRSDVVCVAGTRDCELTKSEQTWRFCSNFNYNHQYTTLRYTTVQYTPLHSTPPHHTTHTILQYTTLHSPPLHYTPHTYTTLHYTPLHCTIYTILHSTTTHTPLHSTPLHSTPLHSTPLHSTQLPPHYTTHTTLNYNTLQYTPLRNTPTTLHSTTLHCTTLHYTTLRYTQLRYATHTAPTTNNHNYNYATLHYSTLHKTTLHYTRLRYIAPPYIALTPDPLHLYNLSANTLR